MSKKEKLATIGTYIVFIGTLIPVFFNNVSTVIWAVIIGIGFGFLVGSGLRAKKEIIKKK